MPFWVGISSNLVDDQIASMSLLLVSIPLATSVIISIWHYSFLWLHRHLLTTLSYLLYVHVKQPTTWLPVQKYHLEVAVNCEVEDLIPRYTCNGSTASPGSPQVMLVAPPLVPTLLVQLAPNQSRFYCSAHQYFWSAQYHCSSSQLLLLTSSAHQYFCFAHQYFCSAQYYCNSQLLLTCISALLTSIFVLLTTFATHNFCYSHLLLTSISACHYCCSLLLATMLHSISCYSEVFYSNTCSKKSCTPLFGWERTVLC